MKTSVRALLRGSDEPGRMGPWDKTMGQFSAAQLLELFVGGLAIGCVYSLVALGFAMIMRATSIIHFAQGEVMMLGAMCGLTSLWLLPVLPLILVVAVGMVSSGII